MEEENVHKVYRHKNPITNEVFYIGQGTKRRHRCFDDKNYIWNEYVEKNGLPIVEIIVENLSAKDAVELEELLIDSYGRIIDGSGPLTNIYVGRKWNEARKKSFSKNQIGEKNHMFGTGDRQIGEKNHMFGKGYLVSGKRNPMYGMVGDKNPFYGKKHDQDFLDRKRKLHGHPIVFNEVKYDSIRQAMRETGVSRFLINKNCTFIKK